MCLAVPGKIISIKPVDEGQGPAELGVVDFQGSRIEIGLQLTPDAKEGDWVLVHAGFALEILDEKEARETWEYLQMAEIVGEMHPDLKDVTLDEKDDLPPAN
jgi:hydrogenase expression/formation protein HypC